MEVSETAEQEMSFSDWSDKLEAGTSHWLPAYGFQQPSQLHEALLQQDYDTTQQSYVYLETIVEETSDDLRSESEYSATGWPTDTDSDAGSVIHLPQKQGNNPISQNDWSGSERDLAVPKKRRRRIYNTDPGVHDDDDDEEDGLLPPLSSRSSSLLQFETLEKQCETTVFRTTASNEPFHSPSLHSSFSFDSLETSRWRFSGSPDSLDGGQSVCSDSSSSCRSSSSSHISSEEDDGEQLSRSFSSRSGNESYRSTSMKSHRSFDSLVACQEKAPTLNSELSQSLGNTMIAVDEEEAASAPPRGLYKTVECLNEAGKKEEEEEEPAKKKSQRSAENLSEDSGFGEHIPRERRTGAEAEAKIDEESGGGWGAGSNYSCWQSAPDLLGQSAGRVRQEQSVEEEVSELLENKGLAMNTVSTPNLFGEQLADGEYELRFGEDRLSRAYSLKEGTLRKTKSKGSNVQITTSFINLNASAGSLHKVHFSNVVSEVSFRERASEEELPAAVGKEESGGDATAAAPKPVVVTPPQQQMEQATVKSKLGSFFQRFSLRRLSGRDKKRRRKQEVLPPAQIQPPPPVEDQRIVPLHPPERTRPQPPPAVSTMPTAPKAGLLETDLDSVQDVCAKSSGQEVPKTRSLLDLGGAGGSSRVLQQQSSTVDSSRAKSMEFLLDKQAQFSVKPPENELQKVGERVMSEHELRVQRSLQRLNVPEWYKNSQVPQQGFLLKRHSEGGVPPVQGWQGLTSKTTSLSSLGSRSPTGNLLSPSPTPSTQTFTRWSTTRLSSNPGSTSTSPSGSARSSFNYRQPYLGWRSQERLTHPRTPAERLAAGILPQKQATPPPVANLSEVHSSIKEVTSAIVHYVSGANKDDRLSPNPPRHDSGSSRSASPRGSTGRLCWLESSFVGNRPVEVPETPVSLTATPEHAKDLYLDLNSISPSRQVNGLSERKATSPPCSATMEDVLDSLLGLTSRSPSPAHSGSASILLPPPEFANEGRRHSEGCHSDSLAPACPRSGRRVSFDMAVAEGDLVRCRYNKCNKTATISEAKKTFKTCHNCTHVYCSRECRRAHWEKHRKTCLHSRVGALCRKVMSSIKEEEETLHRVSLVARRGFLERGRGSVKVFFSCTENAEAFVTEGVKCLGEPAYIKWGDLQPEEMGREMHEELTRLCQNYNPDTRMVLYVCVCVVSEVPTCGPVKWEREMVSRCGKLKLSRGLVAKEQSPASREPDTLILTSLPGARDQGSRKARQVSFTNIQRHLRQRGISLRRQFPDVYQRLCSYVEGSIERFAPVTIYPRDSASGKNFMCIIMPDAEPEKLDLIPVDTSRVQTIDISTEIDSTV